MRGKACVLTVILLLFLVPHARAESGEELVKNSADFDGAAVTFRGEVIGILVRGDSAWVNVLDNGVAIGVWCSANDAKKVSVVGDYTHIGDTVEVVGTFHMACPEHGGDLDIHAENFTVVSAGRELGRSPDLLMVMLSAALVVAAISVTYFLRKIRKESDKTVPWPFQ